MSILFFLYNLSFIISQYLIKQWGKTLGQLIIIIPDLKQSNRIKYDIAKTKAVFEISFIAIKSANSFGKN